MANDRALDVKVLLGATPLKTGLAGAVRAGELSLQWACGGHTVDQLHLLVLSPF